MTTESFCDHIKSLSQPVSLSFRGANRAAGYIDWPQVEVSCESNRIDVIHARNRTWSTRVEADMIRDTAADFVYHLLEIGNGYLVSRAVFGTFVQAGVLKTSYDESINEHVCCPYAVEEKSYPGIVVAIDWQARTELGRDIADIIFHVWSLTNDSMQPCLRNARLPRFEVSFQRLAFLDQCEKTLVVTDFCTFLGEIIDFVP